MKYVLFLSAWLGLASLTRISASPYETSTLTGVVKDDKSEGLIGATVRAIHNFETVRGTITDIEGKYTLVLEPGIYKLECSYTGFKTSVISVTVEKGKTETLDIVLEPGGFPNNGNTHYTVPMLSTEVIRCGITSQPNAGQPLPKSEIRQLNSTSALKIRAKTEATKLDDLTKTKKHKRRH